MTDTRFNKNALFCIKCLIHDHFFRGGGSWAPDMCPKCKGTHCITWENMRFLKRNKAAKLFQKMWKKEHGVDYKFTKPENHPQYNSSKPKFDIEVQIAIDKARRERLLEEAAKKILTT